MTTKNDTTTLEQVAVGGDAATIVATTLAAADPTTLHEEEILAFTLPDGANVHVVDPEEYALVPRRTRGTVRLFDHESLAGYTIEHNADKRARLFFDPDAPVLRVVFNGPTSGTERGWGDHVAEFAPRFTPEWKAWTAISGKLVSQAEFAEFVENQLADVHDPPAAEMLELARTFEADRRVEFRQSTVLESGQRQLTYAEVIDARAGQSGQITVPSRITLGMAVFRGGDAYRLEARLRYRITDGTLKIGVDLIRPDLVRDQAVADLVSDVVLATSLAAFQGIPLA
jgi:uncharacterized protein YfdQ (DUF2303 family)